MHDARASRDLVVYRAVSAAIFEQRLPPQTRLSEQTLGCIFGVSRTVVRQALMRLQHEGLVTLRPNRGATVASPTEQEARDLFRARRVIEEGVIRQIGSTISQRQIGALRKLTRDERAARQRGDRSAWIRLSGAFHLELVEILGNRVLSDILKDLVARTSLVIAVWGSRVESACSSEEHHAILELLGAGETARAVSLMGRHLVNCEASTNLDIQRRLPDLRQVFANWNQPAGFDAHGATGLALPEREPGQARGFEFGGLPAPE